MPKRKQEKRKLKVIILPDSIEDGLLELLFANIRFISYPHNYNNPMINNTCWVRGDDSIEYQVISYKGNIYRCHRLSYELFKGKKLMNLACHHCDVPACINPDHIFDGTNKQNHQDSLRKNRQKAFTIKQYNLVNAVENRLNRHYMGREINCDDVITRDLRKELDKLTGDV